MAGRRQDHRGMEMLQDLLRGETRVEEHGRATETQWEVMGLEEGHQDCRGNPIRRTA